VSKKNKSARNLVQTLSRH